MRYLSNIDLTVTNKTRKDRYLLQFNSFALFKGTEYFICIVTFKNRKIYFSTDLKKRT